MVVAAEIHPQKYYDEVGVGQLLHLSIDKLRVECNRGRLKCTKRAGRRFFRGEWLIAWLEGSDSLGAQTDA